MKAKGISHMKCITNGLIVTLVALSGLTVRAGIERTWIGPSGGMWNVEANWSPNGVPQDGDTLKFGSTAAKIQSGNNIKGLHLAGLSFFGNQEIQVLGQPIVLSGGNGETTISNTMTANMPALELDVEFDGDQAFSLTGTHISFKNNVLTGTADITIAGGKYVYIYGENRINGNFFVQAGVFRLCNAKASLLDPSKTVTVGTPSSWAGLFLDAADIVVSNAIDLVKTADSSPAISVANRAVLAGDITVGARLRWGGVAGSRATVCGNVFNTAAVAENDVFYQGVGEGSELTFVRPVKCGRMKLYGNDVGGTFTFLAPGNEFKSTNFRGGTMRFAASDALPENIVLAFNHPVNMVAKLDFSGTTQTVDRVTSATVFSEVDEVFADRPAKLVMKSTADAFFCGQFNGALSLEWTPSGTSVLSLSNAVSTMSGDLLVRKGAVRFLAPAQLRMGTLEVSDGARLGLCDGAALTVDYASAADRRIGPGRYTGIGGPADAKSVGWIDGVGVLTVRKGLGLMLLLR